MRTRSPCATSLERRASVRPHEGAHGCDALSGPNLPKVATEMALSVLAYNLTGGINIVGTKPLMAAIGA